MTNYRAVMLTRTGGPEVLEVVELPVTDPGPGEVRVRVVATGAGGTDVTMRRGSYRFAPPIPFVPGYEVVGDVEAIGPGVTELHVGQRVAALVVHGGYAEKLVRPAREFVPVPEGLDAGEVVALVLNYVTAYQAIHRVAGLEAGDAALVTGASGGVGAAALELLRVAGVRAFGAASPARHDFVRSLGATPIDSRGAPIHEGLRAVEPSGVDAALDGLGGRFVGQAVRATKRGGVVVGYGFSGATRGHRPDTGAFVRGMLSLFMGAPLLGRRGRFYGITLLYRRDPEPFRQDLPKLMAMLQAGQIRPRIAARLPLLAAREAGERLERGGIEGKIVHLEAVSSLA
jgi:NADPH2:quinone reductase